MRRILSNADRELVAERRLHDVHERDMFVPQDVGPAEIPVGIVRGMHQTNDFCFCGGGPPLQLGRTPHARARRAQGESGIQATGANRDGGQ